MDSGPYHPLIYWPHVLFGIASTTLVLGAILTAKGSLLHRRSGQSFSWFMGIAAVTAIAFSVVRPAPAAIFSAVSVLYGIGMGILSLRARHGGWKALQWGLILFPVLLGIFQLVGIATFFAPGAPPFPPALTGAMIAMMVAAAVFFFWMAIGDVKFVRASAPDRLRRFKRHALRMAVAAAETVRAPLISFGPSLGAEGIYSFPVYFFGPFLLIPAIYYFAMPTWIKRGEDVRAAKASTVAA